MTDNNKELKKFNFYFFFKNLKELNINIKDKIYNFQYFIPKYYFTDKNIITKYYKNKFLINKIDNNNKFIQNILKFNKNDLENINVNMNKYIFDKKCIILNAKLENNSSDLNKFKENNYIYTYKNKDNNVKYKFFSNKNKNNNILDLYKAHKSFFQNYIQPLYIIFINNEYNTNSNNKKYYLQLLDTQLSLVNNILEEDFLGILSKKNIFEIIEQNNTNKDTNKKSNNQNNENNIVYQIFGNNLKINNNSKEEKRKKFYYKISDIDLLYQSYNINNELSKIDKEMKNNFNLFHDELKKMISKKITNLYNLLICSLNMETYFIKFLLFYNNSSDLERLYQLDNRIKTMILKNIGIFKSYYDSYRGELDKTLSPNDDFEPINFNEYFDKELINLL